MLKNNILLRRIIYASIALILLFLSDKQNSIKQSQEQVGVLLNHSIMTELSKELLSSLTAKDFIVKDVNTLIELGGIYKDIKTNEKIINTQYANENHAYDVFIYENYIISVSGSTIFSIALTTPIFETSRGIKIGGSITNVFEKYGIGDSNGFNSSYLYYYEGKFLKFYVDKNENVERIELDLI